MQGVYGIGLEFALIESAVWIMSTFDTHEKVSIKRDSELQMNREIELEVIYRGNSRSSKRNDRVSMKEMKGQVSNSCDDGVAGLSMTTALEAEGIGIGTVVIHNHTISHPFLFK